jgi:hypothetical protein
MNELVVAERATHWGRLKALVLDSVSSPKRDLPCCLPVLSETVGDPDPIPFRSSIARPTNARVYASTETSRRQSQDSGSKWSSLSPFL